MASRRGAYVRHERRSIGSHSDDEEPDDYQSNEEDQGVVRLPTLRSVIVRPNSDEVPERGDDGRESPPLPPLPIHSAAFDIPRHRDDEETNRGAHSREQYHANRRSEENRRRGVGGNNSNNQSGPAFGSTFSQRGDFKERNGTGPEADDMRGGYRARGERRDRDGGHDSSIPERDGGRRAAGRFRDSDRNRDRVGQRRDASRSPLRRRGSRDVEEGSFRRRGKKREMHRSPDDGRYDNADAEKYENDAKGKAKQRDGVRVERDGGAPNALNHMRGRGRHADHNSRGDRDPSPSSGDWRNAQGGSRSPLAAGRSNRVGRNGADWGRDRERDGIRDGVRGGRGETDRERDGGRGEAGETPVPELYSIQRATVHSITAFGIFVRMDGYRNHGLVHLAHLSHHEVTNRKDSDEKKIEAISSVVSEGEQVWVKIISVQHEDGKAKVGCSLKLVSQGDGKDLDPNNLQLEKYQSKGPWQPPKKLELDAVLNVSCTRCGGHGHLKKECYSTGEKTYELLEDADAEDDGVRPSKPPATIFPKNLAPGVGPSSKPPTGPVGRGRAMVQPAWMTHGVGVGVGVGGDQEKVLRGHSSKAVPELPEKVNSLEDALAVLGRAKEEKRKRRLEKRHRKQRKRERRHASKERQKEKHKKRNRSDDDHHHRNKRKRRV